MKNIKKFLGVVAVVLAAPLFLGGTVACSKDCKAKCEDLNKTCNLTNNCTTSCDTTVACYKENQALGDCLGTGSDVCACFTVDGCAQLGDGGKCKTQFDAVVACLTPA